MTKAHEGPTGPLAGDRAAQGSVLDLLRRKTIALAEEHAIGAESVEVVSARPLTAEEAIGKPERTDFPILTGKESMMEARFQGARGHAFTSMPGNFAGSLDEVLGRVPETDFDRALLVATANAVLAHLGLAEKTVHCRDAGPKECAAGVVEHIRERFGDPHIGFIGLQPALVSALVGNFPLRVTDMDPDNIGRSHLGVVIEGADATDSVIDWADLVMATGTVLANDTIAGVLSQKPTIFYGTTIAGTAALLGYDRYCPCGT